MSGEKAAGKEKRNVGGKCQAKGERSKLCGRTVSGPTGAIKGASGWRGGEVLTQGGYQEFGGSQRLQKPSGLEGKGPLGEQ